MLFNDFKKNYETKKTEIDEAIGRVLNSGWFILGKEVENFEFIFSQYLGSKHCIGVANGLEAIQIALLANDIQPGDEVITTSLSAVATSLAIKAVGGRPVFVDIDEYYHLDASKLEEAITPQTKAIIPVHLYGQSVDLDKITTLAKKYNLAIIEDCAQAHGAEWRGQKVGTYGRLGCFSFYPTKNLGSFGDAGAIVTDDDILAEKCYKLRNYGQKSRYEHELCGLNSRLDEIQAAILSTLLPDLDRNNQKRQQLASIYRDRLQNVSGVTLPKERKNSGHIYHLFVVESDRRDELQQFLKEKDIPSLIHYPIPIHKQKCFAEYNNLSLPATEKKVDKILSLPIHPQLTQEEIMAVCDAIKKFFDEP